ncbi:MAG: hypothetical protein AAFV93_02410 [Chloroflexota bacterium]
MPEKKKSNCKELARHLHEVIYETKTHAVTLATATQIIQDILQAGDLSSLSKDDTEILKALVKTVHDTSIEVFDVMQEATIYSLRQLNNDCQ